MKNSLRADVRRCARAAGVCLLLAALGGCALLRSREGPPEEWTFVAFPGTTPSAHARAASVAAGGAVAAACASPSTVTFSLEPGCGAPGAIEAGKSGELLLVSNWSADGYRPDILRAIMSEPDTRGRFAAQAAELAAAGSYGGLLLDFQTLGPRDVDGLVTLVAAVADSARAHGASRVGIVIPVSDTSAYPGRHLGALTDFLVVRLELERAAPGPLTPRDRMARLIGARAAEIGAHRLMLLLPADGYLWRDGEPRRRVTFAEAAATAREWGVDFARDESSFTLYARAARRGELWVNDAALVERIVRDARKLGIRRFALYGLGGEDPGILAAVAAPPSLTR